MKAILQKISENIQQNKFYYFLVLLFFCIGIVLGVFTVQYMDASDKKDLSNYLGTFVNGLNDQNIDYGSLLIKIAQKSLFIIIPIFIVGFTFFGCPIVLIIDFIKGFSLGYTFSFLIHVFEGKGIVLALVSVVPQNLIYVPCIISLSVISIIMANNRLKIKLFKNQNLSIPKFSKRIINYSFIFILIFGGGIALETFICPSIIKFVVTKFYT